MIACHSATPIPCFGASRCVGKARAHSVERTQRWVGWDEPWDAPRVNGLIRLNAVHRLVFRPGQPALFSGHGMSFPCEAMHKARALAYTSRVLRVLHVQRGRPTCPASPPAACSQWDLAALGSGVQWVATFATSIGFRLPDRQLRKNTDE